MHAPPHRDHCPVPSRRPRFALVLTALLALAAIAVLLAGRGSRKTPSSSVGPSRACVTSRAGAEVTARSHIVITATAQAPVSVTEQAIGSKGIATVTRTTVVSARVRATQPVAVRRGEVAAARSCAAGESPTAARTRGLRQAYARALARAHARASHSAALALRAAMRRLYPQVLAQARARAAARAHALALAARPSLAAQARAQAARKAAG
jgi:hypothetical protein